jgi:two-component system OmpR family sensor kinase
MSRLPIRIRLTLAFTLVMAVVLAATGLFLYLRLASGLDRTLDQGLRTRAADVAALVQQSDTGLQEGRSTQPDSGFAQVIDSRGGILDATPGIARRPLLTAAQLRETRVQASFFDRTIGTEHVRLLAVPTIAQDQRLVVVVGASLEPRTETLGDLRGLLLVGGPIALVLASLAGYLVAAAALRPVELMSERAATISAASPGRRLPVPPTDDEIARLGRRLNEMLSRLERALERERTLVADASHELRTPLSLLKTEIELALDEPESASVLASALRSAAEETDRLSQLTDDLLLLARADSGELPLRRSDVPAAELLGMIATRYERRAGDGGRTIEVVSAPGLVVRGDRRRLEQALANLVENALRHGAGTLKLQATEENGAVELRVGDEGTGFPPVFIARAFERFSRAERSREAAGGGLGLAIVDAIAHAHGGTAAASNHPDGGAEVTLRLPRSRPEDDLTTARRRPDSPTNGSAFPTVFANLRVTRRAAE